MVLDAEYCQPSGKTIQIGAAIYDVRNAVCYGTLDTFVNPGELITPEITGLTGITNQDVQNAPNIIEAYEMLKAFHRKEKCFMNPLVWGSGVRNDSSHLYEEYKAAMSSTYMDREPDAQNFMGFRAIDVKTVYQTMMLFENRQYAGGLADSMKRLGLKFEGEKHRALTDAKNTFTLWYYLARIMHDGFKNKK